MQGSCEFREPSQPSQPLAEEEEVEEEEAEKSIANGREAVEEGMKISETENRNCVTQFSPEDRPGRVD